jgi:predicted transcriptional regulator
MGKAKTAATYRLSADALELVRHMASSLAVSQTAVIELSVREYAKRNFRPKQDNWTTNGGAS